jgi:hypothetical protein
VGGGEGEGEGEGAGGVGGASVVKIQFCDGLHLLPSRLHSLTPPGKAMSVVKYLAQPAGCASRMASWEPSSMKQKTPEDRALRP